LKVNRSRTGARGACKGKGFTGGQPHYGDLPTNENCPWGVRETNSGRQRKEERAMEGAGRNVERGINLKNYAEKAPAGERRKKRKTTKGRAIATECAQGTKELKNAGIAVATSARVEKT